MTTPGDRGVGSGVGKGVAVERGVAAVVGVLTSRVAVGVPVGAPSPSQAANKANRMSRAHSVMGRKLSAKSLPCVRTGVDCSRYSPAGYSTLPELSQYSVEAEEEHDEHGRRAPRQERRGQLIRQGDDDGSVQAPN